MSSHVGKRVLALRYIRDTILAPTVIGLVTYYLVSRFRLPYKPLLVACGVIVGWPVKFSLRVRYQGWYRGYRARALGAVPSSEARGKLFGDVDVLQEIKESSKDGNIGKKRFYRHPCIHRAHQTQPSFDSQPSGLLLSLRKWDQERLLSSFLESIS